MNEPSAEIRLFIAAFVESIDFLRVLLTLAREPDREWAATEAAAAVGSSLESARTQLDKICARGLAVRRDAPEVTYRYGPRAEELRQLVQELIDMDDHFPVTLIRLVYARPSSAAQAFADAFRLRKP